MLKKILAGLGIAAAAAVVAAAPWASLPPLTYETVTGFPMQVHYRDVGGSLVTVNGVGAVPALSLDRPLSSEQIDARFAEIRGRMQPMPGMIGPGGLLRFVVDDPDGLAWQPAKTKHTSYFYVFAVVEMPRSALIWDRWISELCLVAKTGEAFKRCETHNGVHAG